MGRLLPARTHGVQIKEQGDFECEHYNRIVAGYKITGVTFFNQGVNSIAFINIGGLLVSLRSGGLDKNGNPTLQGNSQTISMPQGYYDTTRYRISFQSQGDTKLDEVDNLVVTYIMGKD